VVRASFDSVARILADGSFRLEDAEVRDDFRVVPVDGELRLASVPRGLRLVLDDLERSFTPYDAHFLARDADGSPSGRLVPDRVFLPVSRDPRAGARRRAAHRSDPSARAGRPVGRAPRDDGRGGRRRRDRDGRPVGRGCRARRARPAAAVGAAGLDAGARLLGGAGARPGRAARAGGGAGAGPRRLAGVRPVRPRRRRRAAAVPGGPAPAQPRRSAARERGDDRRPAGRRRGPVAAGDRPGRAHPARGRRRRAAHRPARRALRAPLLEAAGSPACRGDPGSRGCGCCSRTPRPGSGSCPSATPPTAPARGARQARRRGR
jgi:hypothetical protein